MKHGETISLCDKYGNCFPGGTSGEELAYQCMRHKRCGFDPWVGKIPLEESMATHSSVLAWRIPWTEEPGRLYSPWARRVEHDWNDLACMLTFVCIFISVAIAVHETLSHSSSKLGTHYWFFPTTYLHSVAEMTFRLFCDWRNSIDPSVFLY